MIDHGDARLLLSDLLEGRLGRTEKEAVQAHLESCARCRSWVETYTLAREALDEDRLHHLPSGEVAQFAIEPEQLEPEQLERIATHLRSCESCKDEVETCRDASAAARHGGRRRSVTGRNLRVALAAAIALATVAYPIYIGISRPGPDAGSDAWSGPVGYVMLTDITRGGGDREVLTPRPGQPYLVLAVQPDLPTSLTPDQVIRVAIRDADGELAWQTDLTAAALERDLAAFDVVLLLIPTTRLPAGDYDLLVAQREPPDSPPILHARFSVR